MTTWGIPARAISIRAHFGANRLAASLATHYFALYAGDPFEGGLEPTDAVGGYGRAAVTNGVAMWGTPNGTTDVYVRSLQAVVWPTATALWSIEDELTHWAIHPAATGGLVHYAGEFTDPKIVANIGDQPRALAGAIAFFQG